MRLIGQADRGRWLRPLLSGSGPDMHSVVPRGYSAYARVFHPATRDRPSGTDAGPVSWADVAQIFGKTMHPLAQYHRLAGPKIGTHQEVLDAGGWRYSEPPEGNLDVHVLASVAAILCRHTTTPETGMAAVWEGWGGFTGSAGYRPLTAYPGQLPPSGPGAPQESRVAGSGLLPARVAKGPRLKLPYRTYFLFRASPRLFMDASWVHDSPWPQDPHWPQPPTCSGPRTGPGSWCQRLTSTPQSSQAATPLSES